jgi:hypothetical protein
MNGRRSSGKQFEAWHTVVTLAALGVAVKVLAIAVTFLCSQAGSVPPFGSLVAVLVVAAGGAGLVFLLRELWVQAFLFLRR